MISYLTICRMTQICTLGDEHIYMINGDIYGDIDYIYTDEGKCDAKRISLYVVYSTQHTV